MEQLTLTTPSLLFSAISLLMLAYTNRFLSYAQLVRSLKEKFLKEKDSTFLPQIENLRKRLKLIRDMQIYGILSLLLCVVSMFFIYIQMYTVAAYIFGIALILLIISLAICVREIQISIRALDVHLHDMEI
ncbi:DUF2721 domain-containing protein [Petrimonas sp.]|uniref:DUF2721 domain-containing protein n=1 Tax=Petrimonas sp. TaxID=2023866 RepID=UPI003F5118FE